mmetsp:Transcript_21161/g.47120  ORF Transcript_21161/g.47120 Transcript_21161/m.47120 type:complete len:227 (-) Transcript_21161:718-1398(-)
MSLRQKQGCLTKQGKPHPPQRCRDGHGSEDGERREGKVRQPEIPTRLGGSPRTHRAKVLRRWVTCTLWRAIRRQQPSGSGHSRPSGPASLGSGSFGRWPASRESRCPSDSSSPAGPRPRRAPWATSWWCGTCTPPASRAPRPRRAARPPTTSGAPAPEPGSRTGTASSSGSWGSRPAPAWPPPLRAGPGWPWAGASGPWAPGAARCRSTRASRRRGRARPRAAATC